MTEIGLCRFAGGAGYFRGDAAMWRGGVVGFMRSSVALPSVPALPCLPS
jgi:hypothetical protein